MGSINLLKFGQDLPDTPGRAGQLVGLVPSEAVAVRHVALPGGRRQRDSIVRYALEESLAEDIELLHVSPLAADGEDAVPVLAARHTDLQAWLSWFADRGLDPTSLLPDFYGLPHVEDGVAVAVEHDRVVVRTGRNSGFAVQPVLLPEVLGPAAVAPCKRLVPVEGAIGPTLAGRLQALGWEIGERSDGTDALVRGPGLRTGIYARRAGSGRLAWALAAALLTLALLTEVGLSGYRYLVLTERTQQLQSQSMAVFRETFPDVQRVVELEAQAQQGLQRLQRAQQSRELGFLAMFERLVGVMKAMQGVRLTAVDYRDGSLRVALQMDDEMRHAPFIAALSRQGLAANRDDKVLRVEWGAND